MPESVPRPVGNAENGWLPPVVATRPLSQQALGDPVPPADLPQNGYVDGYDLGGWYVQDATPEEGAAALRAASIPPGEFNAPDWGASMAAIGVDRSKAADRFLFRRQSDGRLVAWRATDAEPDDPAEVPFLEVPAT